MMRRNEFSGWCIVFIQRNIERSACTPVRTGSHRRILLSGYSGQPLLHLLYAQIHCLCNEFRIHPHIVKVQRSFSCSFQFAVKYGIIAAAWLLFFVIGMSGNSKTDVPSQTESVGITETTDALPTDNTITEQPTDSTFTNDTTTEDVVLSYAEDQVVNRFISEFNAQSAFEITDISKGNIKTKYFGSANGRYLEMINANDAGAEAFYLTINGGQEDSDKQSMYEVFREAVKVLDSSITDDMIDAAIAEFNNKDVLIEGYVLSDCITITFVPIKELSYGKTSCRIDINASNCK